LAESSYCVTPEEDQAAGEDWEVRAVLETSALLSYARGHVHVGELLIDIADEGVYMGLPSVALLDAHARLLRDGPARARLGVLVTLPGVAVLLLGDDEASAAAATVPQTDNDLARAHAVWAALKHGAYYLTGHPDLASSVIPVDQIHYIPADDA
jgi:hypothetical protein